MPSVASRNAVEEVAKCVVRQECNIASSHANQGDARCSVREKCVRVPVGKVSALAALSLKM